MSMTPEERAHAVIETEAAYEMRGLGGADALEGRIAQAIRDTMEECAKIADDLAAKELDEGKEHGMSDVAAAIRSKIGGVK